MIALSKNKIKYIRSLELKKNRKEQQAFLAEGPKLVGELISHFHCKLLVATAEWLIMHQGIHADEKIEITTDELSKISLLKTPQQVLAVFELPRYTLDVEKLNQTLTLAIDGVQDPGNLGTIIRIADWFGIEHIICSPSTADAFSPKTIQATMGAIAHVKVYYISLVPLLQQLNVPIYGTLLNGNNMYHEQLTENGVIVMGNEGNGISDEVRSLVNRKLFIPNFPLERETTESLNVAVATSIVCAEFRRQASLK